MRSQTKLGSVGRLGVVLLAAALLLGGCAARNHLRSADSAAAAGDHRSALYHYERALSHDSDLRENEDFLRNLAAAQTRVAYEDAVALRAEGHFEAAARKLRESLRSDPGFAPSVELLAIVNGEAAQQRYAKALASADRGALDAANEHLRVALDHDPMDERIVSALASLRVEALPQSTPGLADYRRALTLAAERKWDQAAGAQRQAVGLNPNLLPARAELALAQSQLAESRRLSDSGAARIRESRISAAIPLFEDSLAVWPYNEPASELLAIARASRAQADEKFSDAVDAAEGSDWDAAIASADAGLVIDKAHAQLRELRPALSARAATDYTRQADAHAEADELQDARDDYLRALNYRRPYAPAQRGLAGVYHAWGADHLQNGRPGAALLSFNQGQTHMATAEIAQGRAAALRALRDNLGMTMALSVADTPAGSAVTANRLADALTTAAHRHERSGFTLRPNQPRFALTVEVESAFIDEQRTSAETRTHRYTVEELRPNPRYAYLLDEIDDLRVEINRLERDYHSHVGPNHGHHQHDPDTHEGRHLNDLNRRIQQRRYALDRLYADLRRTPQEVPVPVTRTTNYTVETYTKTGGLTVTATLVDTVTGDEVASFTEQGSSSHRDSAVPNPQPEIGIARDPLSLPDDSQVAAQITAAAARGVASQAVEAAVMYELDALRENARAQREAGEDAAALESEVAAAVLLDMVDTNASQRVLDKLREDHVE